MTFDAQITPAAHPFAKLSKGKHMTRFPAKSGLFAALVVVLLVGLPLQAGAQTLDRVGATGKLVLGYEAEARPFSFTADGGQPDGYAIALCGLVADAVKAKLNRPDLAVEWKAVNLDGRLADVRDGRIDLLCGADAITLTRRAEVSFSLPVFPSGTGAVMRSDAAARLSDVLGDNTLPIRPIWRGAPARTFLDKKTFAAMPGSTSEAWVKERMMTLALSSALIPVDNYDDGVAAVVDGRASAFFGAIPLLLNATAREGSGQLTVLPRHFTYEPLGFALARGDEDFRLLVDGALSQAYRSDGFRDLFMKWFGPPDDNMVSFFKQTILPD